jgi:hypothetical protein
MDNQAELKMIIDCSKEPLHQAWQACLAKCSWKRLFNISWFILLSNYSTCKWLYNSPTEANSTSSRKASRASYHDSNRSIRKPCVAGGHVNVQLYSMKLPGAWSYSNPQHTSTIPPYGGRLATIRNSIFECAQQAITGRCSVPATAKERKGTHPGKITSTTITTCFSGRYMKMSPCVWPPGASISLISVPPSVRTYSPVNVLVGGGRLGSCTYDAKKSDAEKMNERSCHCGPEKGGTKLDYWMLQVH